MLACIVRLGLAVQIIVEFSFCDHFFSCSLVRGEGCGGPSQRHGNSRGHIGNDLAKLEGSSRILCPE